MMKKYNRSPIWMRCLIILCALIVTGISIICADSPNSRWRWYYSSSTTSMYYDTQTLKYDDINQIAKIWTKDVDAKGFKYSERLITISYRYKTFSVEKTVFYKNGYPQVYQMVQTIKPIVPDSPMESLANSVGAIYHQSAIYPSGPNRWRWIHSTDKYSMYIASGCEIYYPETNMHLVWIKRTSIYGGTYVEGYYCNFSNETIMNSGKPRTIIPESDDEYIYDAAKDLFSHPD
ncbi:hypothetical protein [Megasphaera sp.]|uniref:hypothetical protein n=1 Tax=Megasphaera sp. TaxID=2023260 RepID=UPI0035201184